MLNTPILFIIFNRPETERKVFEQIRKTKPKYLYVAADGPRKDRPDDLEKCNLARKIIDEEVDWDCQVKKLYRDKNLGCKMGVSGAISWFFENVEEGIILEDDCIPHLSFFEFCSEMLKKYRDNDQIMHISGDNNQPKSVKYQYSYYFSKYPSIWGWATWRRSWEKYCVNISNWRNYKKEVFRRCSLIEQIYWSRNFDDVSKRGVNTWDYQWVYTVFKYNGLAVIPSVNLVENIGFGNEATHTKLPSKFNRYKSEIFFPLKHPKTINIDLLKDEYSTQHIFQINIVVLIISFVISTNIFKNVVKVFDNFNSDIYWILSIILQYFRNRIIIKFNPIVRIKIWGESLWLPLNHVLPLYSYKYKNYSRNLGRLVKCLIMSDMDFSVVDVGANVGDSVLLIKQNADVQVLCIEGDRYFFDILVRNVVKYNDVVAINSYVGDVNSNLLANTISEGSTLQININSHQNNIVKIDTVDNIVFKLNILKIKLLKIDTDGFDAKVIRGSIKVLTKYKPLIYFEFDESLYSKCGEKTMDILSFLVKFGYEYIVAYDNYGVYLNKIYLSKIIDQSFMKLNFSNKVEYFDLIVFHHDDKKLFEKFNLSEVRYFLKNK